MSLFVHKFHMKVINFLFFVFFFGGDFVFYSVTWRKCVPVRWFCRNSWRILNWKDYRSSDPRNSFRRSPKRIPMWKRHLKTWKRLAISSLTFSGSTGSAILLPPKCARYVSNSRSNFTFKWRGLFILYMLYKFSFQGGSIMFLIWFSFIKQNVKKKQRIKVIEYWIEVARECFNIGNFNSLMAIIAGLNMSPVSRLKKTVI